MIEIFARAAEGVEGVGYGKELRESEFLAGGVERLIADGVDRRGDEREQGHDQLGVGLGKQLDDVGEHLVTVFSRQAERELGG